MQRALLSTPERTRKDLDEGCEISGCGLGIGDHGLFAAHAQNEAAHGDGPSFSCLAARTVMEQILHRLDPQFAPVLEAVALWVREPVDADWSGPERTGVRTRISALLSPYLSRMSTDEGQSFGWSILSEPYGASPKVKTMSDLFASDRHFAVFLNVLGPYLDTNTALDVLAAKILSSWPDCDRQGARTGRSQGNHPAPTYSRHRSHKQVRHTCEDNPDPRRRLANGRLKRPK
ncbi:MAG: hypothetical protein QM681_04925 [Novosphingobium sp.]